MAENKGLIYCSYCIKQFLLFHSNYAADDIFIEDDTLSEAPSLDKDKLPIFCELLEEELLGDRLNEISCFP